MKCHNVEFQNPPVCGGLTKSTVQNAHMLEDLLETPNFQHHKSQQTPWAKGPQHGLSFHINSRIPLLLNRSLSASKSGAVSDIATSPAANPKSSKVSKTIAFSNAFMFVGVGWDVCRDVILVISGVLTRWTWPWQLLHVEAIKSIKLCCFVIFILFPTSIRWKIWNDSLTLVTQPFRALAR